jgi:GTP-binding protein
VSKAGRREELAAVTREYFGRRGQEGQDRQDGPAVLLLVDARHPGLDSDIEAWRWLRSQVNRLGVVATKIDKLSRAERRRALIQLETQFEDAVLPCSADTGEGLERLWTLIDRLVNSHNPPNPRP